MSHIMSTHPEQPSPHSSASFLASGQYIVSSYPNSFIIQTVLQMQFRSADTTVELS